MVHRPHEAVRRALERMVASTRNRGDGAECLRKVKAHTTGADIGVTEIDRIGNDLADAIAKEALSRFPYDSNAQARFEKRTSEP